MHTNNLLANFPVVFVFFFYFLSFLFLFSFFCVPVRIAFLHFTSRLACAAAAAAASPRWGEFRLCAACELWALRGHFHQARESADRRERAREQRERACNIFTMAHVTGASWVRDGYF